MGNRFGFHRNPEEKLCEFCFITKTQSVHTEYIGADTQGSTAGTHPCLQVLKKAKAFVVKKNRKIVYQYAINCSF